ncbi:hypothetical protein INR49_027079 [Caranx melampygus]|nr:hypothetical protein INR49_027079 [Caranx melampygus]
MPRSVNNEARESQSDGQGSDRQLLLPVSGNHTDAPVPVPIQGGWGFPQLEERQQAVQLGLAGGACIRKLLLASTSLYLGFSARRRISASRRCRKPGSMAVPPITTRFSESTLRSAPTRSTTLSEPDRGALRPSPQPSDMNSGRH